MSNCGIKTENGSQNTHRSLTGSKLSSEIDYQQSDYATAKSVIKHDEDTNGPPVNVILVGTKVDKVNEDESAR